MTPEVHIKSDLSTATARVTDIETGNEIKGITKITLVAEPGKTWIAHIELRVRATVDVRAEAK